MRRRPPRGRRRAPALTAAAALSALTAAVLPTAAVGAACANASALVAGATEDAAIAYDASCRARVLQVSESGDVRALNASHLELARVSSLPRLHALDASTNALESLTLGSDQDLARLCVLLLLLAHGGRRVTARVLTADCCLVSVYRELRDNRIADLSLSAFPPRLTYL